MDTLIKIILKKYKFNSYDIKKEVVFQATSLSEIRFNNNMFGFKEYDKIELIFESNIENSVLKVESFLYDDLIKLYNGDSVYLSYGGDSDKMFPPGFYNIELYVDYNCYKGLYSIEPNSINYQSLLHIKDTLESMCAGLSSNIFYERSSYDFIDSDSLNVNLLMFNYIESNAKDIAFNLSSILKQPIDKLEKQYNTKLYSKKVDSKSIRWKNSKGISHNSNAYKEKHCFLSYDTRENMLLKSICERLVYSIAHMEKSLKNYLDSLECKKDAINKGLLELKDNKHKLSNINNTVKRQDEVKGDISISEKDLSKYSDKINKLNSSIKNISHSKITILLFLEQEWVRMINSSNDIKPTKKFIKRPDYNFFYNLYLNIFEKNKKREIVTSFSSKKTSLLYELYSFICILKVLQEIDFEWVDGWLKSQQESSSFNCDLDSGETIILQKDNIKLELTYDYTIPRASEIKGNNISQIVASNSNRRKPDILISIYKDNVFIKSMIIEVKYRKEAYIYNKNGETDVIHQLKDYRNLDFYDGNKCKVSDIRPIQKILVVYPYCEEKVFKEDIYGFTFISLMPNENNEIIGYNTLYNEVNEFLQI